jgi:2'-5' RNA ligase
MPASAAGAEPRLFLALWPGRAAREALAAQAGAWAWPAGARPVAPARWHATLHFIGPVPAARLDEVAAGLAVPMAPAWIAFDRAEVWPGPAVAVLEATQVPQALDALHQRLGQALRALGLPVEARPWRPHVTLARHARGATAPAGLQPVRWRVSAYRLVESVPGPGGGYRTVRAYPPTPARP